MRSVIETQPLVFDQCYGPCVTYNAGSESMPPQYEQRPQNQCTCHWSSNTFTTFRIRISDGEDNLLASNEQSARWRFLHRMLSRLCKFVVKIGKTHSAIDQLPMCTSKMQETLLFGLFLFPAVGSHRQPDCLLQKWNLKFKNFRDLF